MTTLTTNLVSYYTFDTNLTDSLSAHDMANGDAAPTSGATGIINDAIDFEYTNHESLKTTTRWITSGAFSVSAWINRESQASIFNEVLGQTNTGVGLHLGIMGAGGGGTANRLSAMSLSTMTYPTIPFGSTNLPTGSWVHVVWTYDPAANPKHCMYVDGVAETVTNNNLTISDWGDDTSNCIGAYHYAAGSDRYNFDGIIDEVGIWDKVLSQAEVTELYNGGAGLQYPFVPPASATITQVRIEYS
jgi:hypothetical protein